MDREGTTTGSSFTITVSDSNPHFYYMVRDWYGNCSFFADWTSIYGLDSNGDIFFALNPVPSLVALAEKLEWRVHL